MTTNISANDKEVLNQILDPLHIHSDLESANTDDQYIDADDPNTKKAKVLEVEGVQLAESGDLSGAVDKFTSAINIAPNWASSYNNRAQTHRLRHDNQSALSDLTRAIELTEGRGKVAMQAYTQRAMISHLNGDTERATTDYKIAANLGCGFARTQVVALNPYSALCNQMLSQVIGELQNPQIM